MKYTATQLEEMRKVLAVNEMENMDDSTLFEILSEGCVGYNNMEEEDLIILFENCFGDDYFEVQDEKDHKNNLYGEEV